jgi:hypothetical protein
VLEPKCLLWCGLTTYMYKFTGLTFIINPFFQWHIHRIVSPAVCSNLIHVTCNLHEKKKSNFFRNKISQMFLRIVTSKPHWEICIQWHRTFNLLFFSFYFFLPLPPSPISPLFVLIFKFSLINFHVYFLGNHWHTCSWKEEVAKLVERDGHDAISEVECFLYAVTMVNIYVNVKYSWVIPATKHR